MFPGGEPLQTKCMHARQRTDSRFHFQRTDDENADQIGAYKVRCRTQETQPKAQSDKASTLSQEDVHSIWPLNKPCKIGIVFYLHFTKKETKSAKIVYRWDSMQLSVPSNRCSAGFQYSVLPFLTYSPFIPSH